MKFVLLAVLLGFAAGAFPDSAQQFRDEAADVMRVMEVGRTRSHISAPESPAQLPKAVPVDDSNIDMRLLEEADRVELDMQHTASRAHAAKEQKTAALASKASHTMTRSERVGRYLARHGMHKVADLLGHSTANVAAEAKAAHQAAQTASVSSSDVLAAEEKESETYRSQWRAVDALRKRRPSFA
mmetsp:Transcript_12181/g.28415  ORF Transcript_12181/g.28415 Transcript_12181/m.28415 type:complete len:185 (+) Transcript_12181:65-619(+)